MREMKCRSWNNFIKDFAYFENGNYWYFHEGNKITGLNCFSWENAEQFTGLKDRNGVEIYEGDILRDGKGPEGVVFYNPNIACFLLDSGGETFYLNEGKPQRGPQLKYTEVIGNTHH